MTPSMTASPALCDLIMRLEGFRSTAYRDTGGRLTIGFGHTGPHVYVGQTVTHAQALQMLGQDVGAVAQGLCAMLGRQLTQGQFDAVCDFAYNEGLGQFHGSTMHGLLEKGDVEAAAAEFSKWVFGHNPDGSKVPLTGLVLRRTLEARIFRGDLTPPYAP